MSEILYDSKNLEGKFLQFLKSSCPDAIMTPIATISNVNLRDYWDTIPSEIENILTSEFR